MVPALPAAGDDDEIGSKQGYGSACTKRSCNDSIMLINSTGQELAWTVLRCQPKRGAATGPNPTDRGRPGTKRHLLTDRRGAPLAVLLSGANMNDSVPLSTLLDHVHPVQGRRGRPRYRSDKLHADKAHDHRRCRRSCHRRNIQPRIARRGVWSYGMSAGLTFTMR